MDTCVLCDSCQELYDINNNSEKKKFCKKCYNKQYHIDNRETILEQKKQYRIDNREKIKEQNKQQRINNHDIITIKSWKYNGLIELEGVYTYESLYEYYVSISHCEVCNKKFKNSYYRCLDHCHTTGLFRWVLCRSCNTMDKWMNLI
jgi:hypothetical protein